MKFKKTIVLISVLLVLSACTQSKQGNEKKESKVVDNYEISVNSAKKLTSDGEDILQLNFTVENLDADTRSFDSLVFRAENKEKENLLIAPKENFGSDIKPGESIEGSIYYYLTGKVPIQIIYDDPGSEEKETWEIKDLE